MISNFMNKQSLVVETHLMLSTTKTQGRMRDAIIASLQFMEITIRTTTPSHWCVKPLTIARCH